MMVLSDAQKELLKIEVADCLEIDKEKIVPDADIRSDLNADSLDLYELAYIIESELGVMIPDDLGYQVDTVQDFLDWLKHQ